MSDNKKDYGLLINRDLKLHRKYFKEMTRLIGIYVTYRAPLEPNKKFDLHGDLNAQYYEEERVGCIFEQHIDQKTLRKMGWVAELQEGSSIIHVPYDLPHLQVGALFLIPSGLDTGSPRWYRVISMSNIMIYPASIACEIAPEYEDIDEPSIHKDYSTTTGNLLTNLEGDD